MEQKIKFILIGFLGIILMMGFFLAQTVGSKSQVMRERDDLAKENASLNSKAAKLENELRSYDSKIKELNSDLETAGREKENLQSKYDVAMRDQEELISKIKSQSAELRSATAVVAKPQEVEVVPQSPDTYWAQVLKEKTELQMKLDNLRTELKSVQVNSEQLQREKSSLELDINSLKHEKDDLKRQLDYNQKVIDSVTQELVRERNDKNQIQNSFKMIKNENTALSRQLKALNERKIGLERKLEQLREDKVSLEHKFTEMDSMLSAKVSQIGDLTSQLDSIRKGTNEDSNAQPQNKRESVELPAIVIRPQSDDQMPAPDNLKEEPQAARVLAVNKDSNFVIIDLGQDSGIKAGDTFQIYREHKPIASIEVIQVRKNISACDIKKEITPIKIGDAVK